MKWITRWDEIDGDKNYICFAITANGQRVYCPQMARGWQVKQRIEGCYAAIEVPPFPGIVWPTLPDGKDPEST